MKNKSSYTRRDFIGKIGTAAAAIPVINSVIAGQSEEGLKAEYTGSPEKPNIIFILSDDHRYDFMGFMGKPKFLKTPHMDRMAKEGAHIQNAFVTTALCSPSRASILTGLYSHKHGIVDNDSPGNPGNIFFPEYLKQQGYETAFMGKWHMGNASDEPQKGFDKWISFKGQGVYYDPELNIDGQRITRKGYITDILTEYALEFINAKREKPFFLYLSHKAVHSTFEPAERHRGKYENEVIEYPSTMADTEENYKDKPAWVKAQRNSWHGVDFMYHGEIKFDQFYRRYCETLLALDESIGSVIGALEKNKMPKSTVVFYMGDNGFSLGEHGLIDKRHMYEESIHVPLLAYSPGLIKPGMKISELVQNIDIAPTILELAGIKAPQHMDGKSFVPIMQGKKTEWRDSVCYEYYWERPFPQTPTTYGVRTGKYKYITYHGVWDMDELYDIENDPEEKINLIKKPEYKEIAKDLNKKLYDWLESTEGMKIPLKRDIGTRLDKRKGEI